MYSYVRIGLSATTSYNFHGSDGIFQTHSTYIRWKLRTCLARMKANKSILGEQNPILDCFRFNQMPSRGKIQEIAPYLRTYF